MSSGQVKFSVQLEKWPWSSDGQFVDIDIIVKLPKGRIPKKIDKNKPRGQHPHGKQRPEAFDFGSNALAFFSRKVSTVVVKKAI